MKTITIYLKDKRRENWKDVKMRGKDIGTKDFIVTRVINSVSYEIGSYLSRATVNKLCSEAGVEVIIK